ncbi:MAG: class I SAM-dependent methyltransferase [Myxococcota bacterium]
MNPALESVPETMLWTLHNRASEALRADGIFQDPEAVRIYRALEYDYERSFGPGEASHALRSMLFDGEIRRFAEAHPDAVIVNLGEGLETQRYRVEGEGLLWLSVDLPEALRVREAFITPDETHRHVACSALDPSWLDAVPTDRPVFITAQGLFMYFDPRDLAPLIAAVAERFPGGALMFDTIPPWLSKKTLSPGGWQKTPHYTTPPMPWGIRRGDLEATLRRWAPSIAEVTPMPYPRFPRGFVNRWVFPLFEHAPGLRNLVPTVALVCFRPA